MHLTPVDIQTTFRERFNKEPLVIRSPGRINLIGEHTDYNDGLVMPAAINKEIFFAISASSDDQSSIYAMNYDQLEVIDVQNPKRVNGPAWVNYLAGVLYQFRENGYAIKPFNCVFGGNIPLGAGLSSSAALECGFAFALSEFNLLNIPRIHIVEMAQWAEHNFAGVKCGIMDQFASVMGKEDHVIVLDCRSMEAKKVKLQLGDYRIILCDSKVKHSLANSEYNTRRKESEEGVEILKKDYPKIRSLRDVTHETLIAHREKFPEKVFSRCLYVVDEIDRVRKAEGALERGDLASFGKRMFETHEGLSKLYEVSCPELDFLVEIAKTHHGVVGSRMMGGGFGGCTINLVRKDMVDAFITHVGDAYRSKYSIDMEAYRVGIADGTSRVPDSELALWA